MQAIETYIEVFVDCFLLASVASGFCILIALLLYPAYWNFVLIPTVRKSLYYENKYSNEQPCQIRKRVEESLSRTEKILLSLYGNYPYI